ncbi:MAG: hypothetical protein EPN33_04130 [Acidobacteria bacterium]|nr:MAG: hypothetical protein EPN33_04130 [Acidobacteriota bacterium]
MTVNPDRFITATSAKITYCLDQVCYYEIENDHKIELHFSDGNSKDIEGSDVRDFLSAIGREPMAPGRAA